MLPQEKRYCLSDVLNWEEDVELIDGVPIMLATPARVHQRISMDLTTQLNNYLAGKKCEVYAAPFAVRLFEKGSDSPHDVDTMVEPDISVICDPEKLDDIGCKGAPDLIIEILSPSTRRHDLLTKFNLYLRAGVREYWIVDPASKDVQVFLLEDGHYFRKDYGTAEDTIKVNVLENCRLDLSKIFA